MENKSMTFPKIIDVCFWEPNINWPVAITSGKFSGAIVRAGQGIFVDAFFHYNCSALSALQFPHGSYFVMEGTMNGVTQANKYLSIVKALPEPHCLLCADLESTKSTPHDWAIENRSTYWNRTKAFVGTIEDRLGRKPVIYTASWFINPMHPPSWLSDYDLWIMSLDNDGEGTPPIIPNPWRQWTIWQYNFNFSIPGTDDTVDVNSFNGNDESLKAYFDNGEYMPPTLPQCPFDAKISNPNASRVNIRRSPDENSTDLGDLLNGAVVTIFEVKDDIYGNTWGRISPGLWIAVKYCGSSYITWEY